MPKKHVTNRGRPGYLAKLSIDQLTGEISRRRDVLQSARAEFEASLASVTEQLAQLDGLATGGVAPRRRGPGRPRGTGAPTGTRGGPRRGRGGKESLASVLHSLLQGRTMTVPEMAEAAKKAGHKSKSKNFSKVVSLALINHRKMFKRVARGQYTAQ